jgi:hypothetical protein
MNVALGHPSGELSVGRTQLDGPLADQPQAGVSVGREGGATPQIANHEMPGQRGQAGPIEAIEGGTMLQEIAYLGQFVMHVAFPFRVVFGLPGSCGGLEPWPVRPARHRGTLHRRFCPASLQNNILARAARQIAADWQLQYGYHPLLLETFVEQKRFRGTAYQAANWLCLGQTSGRGKLDVHHQALLPIKAVWVYPLDRHFRRVLCA